MKVTRWICILTLMLFLFSSCADIGSSAQSTAMPTPEAVNGFGSAANHAHSLLVLPNHILLLATHFGLFRSPDDGHTWQEVAGGPGQQMDGLMTDVLSVSPLDPQRLYVVTVQITTLSKGIVGLYSSSDQGRTWQLSSSAKSLKSSTIFTDQAGGASPTEVYIYLSSLGAQGLRVSEDAGQHFSATGTLPFARINKLLLLPGSSGTLLVSSENGDGVARSTDKGVHWQYAHGVNDVISDMVASGVHGIIYARGDAGTYISKDEGRSFQLVYETAFANLTTSPSRPEVVYGETAQSIYRSKDGGKTWIMLPKIAGSLGKLAVDPQDASKVYLSLNYPTRMYSFKEGENGWHSLTPKIVK